MLSIKTESAYHLRNSGIVVLCNHDRGSRPVNLQFAAAFGLSDPRT